jgi:hypothetical protein
LNSNVFFFPLAFINYGKIYIYIICAGGEVNETLNLQGGPDPPRLVSWRLGPWPKAWVTCLGTQRDGVTAPCAKKNRELYCVPLMAKKMAFRAIIDSKSLS